MRSSPKRQSIGQLRELQRLTAAAVMRPLTAANKMNPQWVDGTPSAEVIASFIRPNDRMNSLERLQLYNRQYWFRLLDCFCEDYPGLHAVLGQRKFSHLAKAYFSEFPSTSFTMRNLGKHLMRFLESHPELVAPKSQLALEMARLEWAHIEAFDNATETPLALNKLTDSDPQKLRLSLQPYLTLLRLEYPLDEFLISVRRQQGFRQEASNAVENRRKYLPTQWSRFRRSDAVQLAVHRYRNSVFYKRLTPLQFVLLSGLQQNLPLEKAFVMAVESNPDEKFTPKQITKWFRDWSALGWFCNAPKN